jgi:hypothetical protein
LEIQRGLPESLILGVKERAGLFLVFSPQAGLLTGLTVLAVERSPAAKQGESCFHGMR